VVSKLIKGIEFDSQSWGVTQPLMMMALSRRAVFLSGDGNLRNCHISCLGLPIQHS
jgi:hypothetical protein